LVACRFWGEHGRAKLVVGGPVDDRARDRRRARGLRRRGIGQRCLANLCNPKSGLCITLPAHEGSACDADGNPCTAIDSGGDVRLVHADRWGFSSCSQAGACAAVSQKGCSDGDVCTADWCDATDACKATKQADLCSDDDACTLIDLCVDDGSCKPGVTLICDDDNPCTTETCD